MADLGAPDELTRDVMYALRELPRLMADSKYTWVIKGLLERQLMALSRMQEVEARLRALEARGLQKPS
jgi:hypothetical protein